MTTKHCKSITTELNAEPFLEARFSHDFQTDESQPDTAMFILRSQAHSSTVHTTKEALVRLAKAILTELEVTP